MELEIVEEKNNIPLERTEIKVRIKSHGTPKRIEVKNAIVAAKNVKEDQVIVKKIHQETGKNECEALVYIYKNKDALRKIEPEYILKRLEGSKNEQKEASKE